MDPQSSSPQKIKSRGRVPGATRLALLAALMLCPPLRAENLIPFTKAQRETLTRLVQSDAEAAKLFKKFRRLADASLEAPPHPVERIASAGILASDPAKVESRLALGDMKKIQALGFAYAVTSQPAYGSAAKRLILGWSETYQPSGQPVDETKLEPLFISYGLNRPVFSAPERATVESWLRLIARREWEGVRPDSVTVSNNWNSHRLNIIGQIGFVLADRALIDRAVTGFKKQIASNLRPDGSSLDFHERDALHYHCYDLEPLLSLAIAAHQEGLDLYDYESPAGASLRKSVGFLVPYCNGSATHAEWVKSKVAFDRERADAGEMKFKIGSKFNPQDGLQVLALAAFFDPSLKPLVANLAQHEESVKFPVWQSVLNEALRS
jgi:hypothetical protein